MTEGFDVKLAEMFMEQCIGEYSGHMSNIPFNPTISSMCQIMMKAHIRGFDIKGGRREFAIILREMADVLQSPDVQGDK